MEFKQTCPSSIKYYNIYSTWDILYIIVYYMHSVQFCFFRFPTHA